MAVKEESPNWGGWIKKGLTTLCETWVLRPDWRDASLNHAFLGDIAAWYVSDLVGINCSKEKPGFAHVIIAPHFPVGLDYASASYDSANGLIEASWKRDGDKIQMDIYIPIGCTAELKLEDGSTKTLTPGKNVVKL